MKKIVSLLLALTLAALMPLSALAGGMLDKSVALDRSVTLGRASNTYIAYENSMYYLCDANGVKLSEHYASMSYQFSGALISVELGAGVNDEGVLEAATGAVLVPAVYGDTDVLSEKWAMGIALTSTTDDPSDYKTWDGNERYNIDYVDVYYCGQKVATLTRDEYRAGYFSAYGDFVGNRQSSTKALWINKNGNRTEVTDDSYVSTSEYEDVYKKGIVHNATQQYAFTATCTLTPDQVVRSIWYNDDGNFIDLQGNVINQGPSAYKEYDSVYYYGGDYMCIRANSKYGIVDKQGNEILPAVYAGIGGNSSNTGYYFASGYQAMLDTAGRLVYLDKKGNVTASVDFTLSENDYKGFYNNAPIIAVKNMGSFMIITATKGVLPTTYEDATTVAAPTQRIISVKQNGLWGCIDMNGNTVVPFVHTYSLDISADGTLATGRVQDGGHMIYHISYVEDVPAEPVLGAGEWQSTCGAIISSKFCPECGESQPVNGCGNCGYVPAGETPKFCPECGTKF